jgi:hypothetical protein
MSNVAGAHHRAAVAAESDRAADGSAEGDE